MDWLPIDRDAHKASGAAAPEILELGPVPEGWVWELNYVAVEDETTAFTSVRVGIGEANGFRPLEEHIGGVAGEIYTVPHPLIIGEGRFIQARFTGTTSGDKLALYINGRQLRR